MSSNLTNEVKKRQRDALIPLCSSSSTGFDQGDRTLPQYSGEMARRQAATPPECSGTEQDG